jgi:hypothetical protein
LAQIQNQYQQAVNIPQSQPQQINQGLLWVQGETGAKSYLVAPNSTVLLMDSENSRFYLKSADGAGMPNTRTFEYKEVLNTPANVLQGQYSNEKELNDKYVTREEYDGLKRQYDSIMERLDSISNNAEVEQNAKSKSKGRGGNGNEQSDI